MSYGSGVVLQPGRHGSLEKGSNQSRRGHSGPVVVVGRPRPRGTLADVGLIILVRSDGIVFFGKKGGNECCLYTNIIFREIEYGTSHFLEFISKVLGVSSVSSWFSFVFLNPSNRQSGFRSV